MKKIMPIFGLALCVFSRCVNASQWIKLADSSDAASHIFLDVSSIAKVNGLRKAWFRWEHDNYTSVPHSVPTTTGLFETYKSSKDLMYFNCSERTSATIQIVYYTEAGLVIASMDTSPKIAAYTETAPDTIGETMLQAVCAWQLQESEKTFKKK